MLYPKTSLLLTQETDLPSIWIELTHIPKFLTDNRHSSRKNRGHIYNVNTPLPKR